MINYDFLFALDLVERERKQKLWTWVLKKNMDFFLDSLEDDIIWRKDKNGIWMELNMRICSLLFKLCTMAQ